MDAAQIVPVALILLIGNTVQTAVGIGYGVIATPLLVWFGLPLPLVVTLVASTTFIQTLIGSCKLRLHVRWKPVAIASVIRVCAMPFGILLLDRLVILNKDSLQQVLGVLVLLVVMVRVLWHTSPREHLHWAWMLLAFSISGVLGAMSGMAGPPIILWVMSHNWSNQESRAFILALYLLTAPVTVALLWLSYGTAVASYAAIGILYTPVVALGSYLGLKAGDLLSKDRLRQLSYAALVVLALSSILSPLWKR